MALTVISNAPHKPRNILRLPEEPTPPTVSAENWDLAHWPQFRYEIVDALARFPDALQAFIGVVESFRTRILAIDHSSP